MIAQALLVRTRSSWSGRRPPQKPTRRRATPSLRDRYAGSAGGSNVPFLDILEPIQSVDAWWEEVAAGDGIHPGARGYAALAVWWTRGRPGDRGFPESARSQRSERRRG